MGLAQPKKRTKLSHDPRNLSWMNQGTSSYGQRLMQAQGWQEGQSLGARSPHSGTTSTSARSHADDVAKLATARIGVLFKDDNLGLGAKASARDVVEAQRTGLDAFQGLLGRLNGKITEKELEKKTEDRKLAMYAAGRWGGMIFVPGGVLVQGEEFKNSREAKNASLEQQLQEETERKEPEDGSKPAISQRKQEKEDRKRLKAERRQRREEKRSKKQSRSNAMESSIRDDKDVSNSISDGKSDKRPRPSTCATTPVVSPDEAVSSSEDERASAAAKQVHDQKSSIGSGTSTPTRSGTSTPLRNGRHLLRGRNIQAKKMAFADMKGLGEIFMRDG